MVHPQLPSVGMGVKVRGKESHTFVRNLGLFLLEIFGKHPSQHITVTIELEVPVRVIARDAQSVVKQANLWPIKSVRDIELMRMEQEL